MTAFDYTRSEVLTGVRTSIHYQIEIGLPLEERYCKIPGTNQYIYCLFMILYYEFGKQFSLVTFSF